MSVQIPPTPPFQKRRIHNECGVFPYFTTVFGEKILSVEKDYFSVGKMFFAQNADENDDELGLLVAVLQDADL